MPAIRSSSSSSSPPPAGRPDSAIHNYELSNRTPGEAQIQVIASALWRFPPKALREVLLGSSRQALELLFRLSEELELEPMDVDGTVVLGFDASAEKSPKLAAAIKTWKEMLDSEKSGEITLVEFESWKTEFGV